MAALVEVEQRLYGVPGAEVLHFDPAGTYEAKIEPWLDEDDRSPREIEEWSVRDSIDHVPSIDVLLEWIIDWTAENGELTEDGFEAFENAAKHPDVCQAADALLHALASKVTFRMADKHLRSLWVTWNEAGEPMLDGEPLYVHAPSISESQEAQ